MANLYPNGIGASGGSRYAKSKNLILGGGASPTYRGNIYYVHHTGSDSNSGLEINKPLATVGKAVGVGTVSGQIGTCTTPGLAKRGDVVAMLPGHRETIRYNIASPKTWVTNTSVNRIKLIGMGDGGQTPYIDNEDDVSLAYTNGLQIVAGVIFGKNLARSSSFNPSAEKLVSVSSATTFEDCVFEVGDNDGDPLEESGSNINDYLYTSISLYTPGSRFSRCLFKNSSTSLPQRVQAARVMASSATNIAFDECTFDGGAHGWGPPAFSCGRPWASELCFADGIVANDLVLVNGVDFSVEYATIQSVFVNVKASNGECKVIS